MTSFGRDPIGERGADALPNRVAAKPTPTEFVDDGP